MSEIIPHTETMKKHVADEVGLMAYAVRRWKKRIPQEALERMVKRMDEIVQKESFSLPSVSGEGMDERADIAAALAVRAAGVMASLAKMDQDDEHLDDKNNRLNVGLATENIGVAPTILRRPIRPELDDD